MSFNNIKIFEKRQQVGWSVIALVRAKIIKWELKKLGELSKVDKS